MKIFSKNTALTLLAVVPAMVQARGARSYRRRQQDQHSQRRLKLSSPQAIEDQARRHKNLGLIRARAAADNTATIDDHQLNLEKSKGTTKADVVIGGVGYAAARLGQILAETQNINFVMLEASDRIGGRMHNVPFGAGDTKYSIELGAQFIDGIEGSPNWDLAIETELVGIFDDFYFEVYDENGERDWFEEDMEEGSECLAVDVARLISDSVALDCLQLKEGDSIKNQTLCDSIMEDGSTFVPGSINDLSVGKTWDMAADFRIPDRSSPASARTCQAYSVDFEQGLGPNEISTKNSFPSTAYIDYGDGDYFVSDNRGFSWLPKFLCAKYLSTSVNTPEEISFDDERLKMNHKITKVTWDPEGKKDVIVDICLTNRVEDAPDQPVLFPCKEGHENHFKIKAKDFVSTFPVSVIRESIRLELDGVSFKDSADIAPRFVPALSETIEGIDVILGYRAGIYNKAFFQFPMKFWSDTHYMLSAYSAGDYVGDFAPLWSNRATENLDPKSNILHLYSFGDRAYELDAMSEEDAIEELLPVLNDMFESNITSLYGGPLTKEDVRDFYLSRWTIDPLFYGGFDVEHINIPDRKIFRQRYGNLVFSGVYSCDRHNGWTHGALLAGERTGMFLLKERYGYDDLDTKNMCDYEGGLSERTSFPTEFAESTDVPKTDHSETDNSETDASETDAPAPTDAPIEPTADTSKIFIFAAFAAAGVVSILLSVRFFFFADDGFGELVRFVNPDAKANERKISMDSENEEDMLLEESADDDPII